MKRSLVLFGLVVIGSLGLGVLGVTPAAADGGFTLDPPGVNGQLETFSTSANFSGTLVPEQSAGIYAFIDGALLTCEDYFSNELNPDDPGCWRIGTVEGSTWSFNISNEEIERLGLTFLGEHHVQFVLTHSSNSERVVVSDVSISIEFVARLATPTPTPTPEAAPALPPAETPVEPPLASGLSTGHPASPSVLSSLRSASDVVAAPGNLLVTAAVTVVLLLLVGLPSALLGQTLSENYDRIFGSFATAAKRAKHMLSFPALPRWLPLAFGLGIATVMSSFVDPGFGWNLGSVRMLASMAIAFAVESVAGWLVIRAVLRRSDPDLDPKPEFKFGSLVIILIAVVLSRVVGFEPGMVFGLVVGLAFGTSLAGARDARVKLIGLGWALAVGLTGWLGYSLLAGQPDWVPIFAAETLSAIAVSSLAALPVGLLPLAGLDGGSIFRWNRWLWAAGYLVALLVFFVVLMPMPFSWGGVGTPLATWVGLYLGYAALAAAVWAWFRFRRVQSQVPLEADPA